MPAEADLYVQIRYATEAASITDLLCPNYHSLLKPNFLHKPLKYSKSTKTLPLMQINWKTTNYLDKPKPVLQTGRTSERRSRVERLTHSREKLNL